MQLLLAVFLFLFFENHMCFVFVFFLHFILFHIFSLCIKLLIQITVRSVG